MIVAYKFNEVLINNYNKENPANNIGCSGFIIILLTLILTAGNVTWIVYQYIWFKDSTESIIMITVTAGICVLFYVLVLFRTREDASLLTSSIVCSYVLYLQWSALASRPEEK